jgi:hypothetical protein
MSSALRVLLTALGWLAATTIVQAHDFNAPSGGGMGIGINISSGSGMGHPHPQPAPPPPMPPGYSRDIPTNYRSPGFPTDMVPGYMSQPYYYNEALQLFRPDINPKYDPNFHALKRAQRRR